MDYRIFNVRKDVNAYNCTQGRTDTVRESALKVGSGRKIPCCTGESNLCERHDGPMLYQLSYIPILMSLTRKRKCTLKYQQKHEAALEPVKKDNGSDAGTLISMNIYMLTWTCLWSCLAETKKHRLIEFLTLIISLPNSTFKIKIATGETKF